jgi:hypothetical protein
MARVSLMLLYGDHDDEVVGASYILAILPFSQLFSTVTTIKKSARTK